LGLFETTVIYCRAVIETGCFEALRRKGEIESKVTDVREVTFKELMRSSRPYLDKIIWEKADKVSKKANTILHSKKEKTIVTEEEAYGVIKDTFAIIAALFSGNNRKSGR
jgi:hypothetical protein